MTAKTDLLPMPKGEAVGMYQAWSYDQMQAYARANVEHHTVALQAEVDTLREALAALITWVPSAATYRRLGFDPEALVQALEKARAALAQEGER